MISATGRLVSPDHDGYNHRLVGDTQHDPPRLDYGRPYNSTGPYETDMYELSESSNPHAALLPALQHRSRTSVTSIGSYSVSAKSSSTRASAWKQAPADASRHPDTLHEPIASPFMRSIEYAGPMLLTAATSGGLLFLVLGVHQGPGGVGPFIPPFLQRVVEGDPKVWTAIFTIISTGLSAVLGWCYSSSVRIILRKRVVTRSHTLKTLFAWLHFAQHSLYLSDGVFWCLATVLSILLLGVMATCINTLLTPIPIQVSMPLYFWEPDMQSDTFREWYLNNNTACVKDGWTPYGSCMINGSLPALLDAGRAGLNNSLQPAPRFSWYGNVYFVGTTGGILPQDADTVWLPVALYHYGTNNASWTYGSGWTVSLPMQGLTADVQCANSSSSPLSFTVAQLASPTAWQPGQVTTICDCSSTAPVVMMVDQDWVQAGLCPGDTTDSTAAAAWTFYARFYGEYVVGGMENITCTMKPYLVNTTTILQSNQMNVTDTVRISMQNSSIFEPMLEQLPQIVHALQSVQGNMAVTSVLETTYSIAEAGSVVEVMDIQLLVWESHLRGWLEYVGTSIREQADTFGYGPNSLSEGDDGSKREDGWFIATGYGWHISLFSYVFVSPILLVTLITHALLFRALIGLRATRLPRFDPTDPGLLMLAGVRCGQDLRARVEAARGRGDELLKMRELMIVEVKFRDGKVERVPM